MIKSGLQRPGGMSVEAMVSDRLAQSLVHVLFLFALQYFLGE